MNMISWKDYEGVDGFASLGPNGAAELKKALLAGNSINAPGSFTAGDGFALRTESLEKTLTSLTFRSEHFPMWRLIPKRPAYNTVEEFNTITSFGEDGVEGWSAEAELPGSSDSTYVRNYKKIKMISELRQVSHLAMMVRPAHGNVVAQETIAGTMNMLRRIEKNLFFGSSALDEYQWDGIDKQISDGAPAANIIDMRGAPLSEDVLMDASGTIMDAPNYGVGTHLFTAPKVKMDLIKSFFPKARYDLFNKTSDGLIGGDLRGFMSMSGPIEFVSDVFLAPKTLLPSGALGDTSRIPPAVTSVTAAATSDAASLFLASDAGAYRYAVSACNRFGDSAPVLLTGTTVSPAAGEKVTLTITPTAGTVATYFKIYRSPVGGGANSLRLIARVANANGVSASAVEDLNNDLPNTSSAYLCQVDSDNLSFAQLAPMMKISLATLDPSTRWIQAIYGTPIVKAPGRNVIFRNVGRADNYVGSL